MFARQTKNQEWFLRTFGVGFSPLGHYEQMPVDASTVETLVGRRLAAGVINASGDEIMPRDTVLDADGLQRFIAVRVDSVVLYTETMPRLTSKRGRPSNYRRKLHSSYWEDVARRYACGIGTDVGNVARRSILKCIILPTGIVLADRSSAARPNIWISFQSRCAQSATSEYITSDEQLFPS